ncbi:MAG: 2-oxo acid dehydrogenase subunit E2 [Candidatus Margulisiibacteriota bacterium]
MNIHLPNLGDGVASATVLSILVKPGDAVQKDQTLLELETDKAVASVPAPASGTIETVTVKTGDTVATGALVMTMAAGGAAAPETGSAAVPVAAPPSLGAAPAPVAPVAAMPATFQPVPPSGVEVVAPPHLRKIAQEIGLDLGRVPAQGGRLSGEDVRRYIAYLQSLAVSGASVAAGSTAVASGPAPLGIDFSKWGDVTIKPASSLRKKIGQKMSEAWTLPHVTQFDEVDITPLMALRKKLQPDFTKKGGNLTVTIFILKAVAETLKKFPNFNASYDEALGDIIYKNYIHLGVAVDTESGLLVPVIRDVDQKSLLDLSIELSEIAEKARARKLGLDDMQGGTFTVSNLGSFGVGQFTPIINKPEVAILGLARGVQRPVYIDKKLEPRMMLPLSLSYDHRIIDGGDGARFIRELITQIEAAGAEA